jgi:hypothetical protein
MKLPLVLQRRTSNVRDLRAGCFVCHGADARWTSANAQALAAQHHDRTGHPTWCDIAMSIRYGRAGVDPRQTDIEDAIALTASASSRGRPDGAPAPRSDAPAVTAADVSALHSRPVETRARGQTPEPNHA